MARQTKEVSSCIILTRHATNWPYGLADGKSWPPSGRESPSVVDTGRRRVWQMTWESHKKVSSFFLTIVRQPLQTQYEYDPMWHFANMTSSYDYQWSMNDYSPFLCPPLTQLWPCWPGKTWKWQVTVTILWIGKTVTINDCHSNSICFDI